MTSRHESGGEKGWLWLWLSGVDASYDPPSTITQLPRHISPFGSFSSDFLVMDFECSLHIPDFMYRLLALSIKPRSYRGLALFRKET